MSDELLKARGRVAANNELMAALRVGIETDIDEARSLLDKFAEISSLQTGKLLIVIDRLNTQVLNYRKLEEQTNKIRAEYNL